jgi:hypothetical protein
MSGMGHELPFREERQLFAGAGGAIVVIGGTGRAVDHAGVVGVIGIGVALVRRLGRLVGLAHGCSGTLQLRVDV